MKILPIVFVFLMIGCATADMGEMTKEEFLKDYPMQGRYRNEILAGEVVPGMFDEEVLISIGKPSNADVTKTGRCSYQWWYYPKMIVFLDCGKVESVSVRH